MVMVTKTMSDDYNDDGDDDDNDDDVHDDDNDDDYCDDCGCDDDNDDGCTPHHCHPRPRMHRNSIEKGNSTETASRYTHHHLLTCACR